MYYESKPDFNAQTSKPIAWMNMNLELITRREYRCILLPASLFESPIILTIICRCGNIVEIPEPIGHTSIRFGFQKNSSLTLLFDFKA